MANPTNQQFGNSGYNRVGDYGNNPYDQRDDGRQGDRYNNFQQGRYDDGRT
jgi:syntaxin 1B/2/3